MSNEEQQPQPLKGPDVSRNLFGGVLEYDGAGHYPGLELLNMIVGTDGDGKFPPGETVSISRTAHDFARRLVWDEEFERHPERRNVLVDQDTEDAIRRLMECLQLEIPSSKKRPTWGRAHFFPYSQSLIHWDARERPARSNKIRIERLYLRGGGAWAYRILRLDPNSGRLDRCRSGFDALLSDQNSPLERLVAVLAGHGAKDDKPKIDEIERDSSVRNDSLEDLYRDGVVKIVEHQELSTVSRIKAMMNWTGFWLMLTQHQRAAEAIDEPVPFLVVDCSGIHPQLRRASQRSLKDAQALIVHAVDEAVRKANGTLPKKRRDNIRGFFWATAATVKLLNAWRGRRHFTLGLDILETLVLAATQGKGELTFEEFVDDWLYGKCRLVVGRSAAERSGLLASFDASIFEDNENHLAMQMEAAGLLTQYSDATRMVSTGGLQ
ncbi:MAG: hypothetical protein KDN20_16230 [Verrucomicrobiae bacterium]|nr:hypothetical protein [Verrucomicrobiae bacterium]